MVWAFFLWFTPGLIQAKTADVLWLTLSPAQTSDTDPGCKLHGQGERPPKARRFESEHRPKPVRTYYITGPDLSNRARAYLLQSDGQSRLLKIKESPKPSVLVQTPFKDDRLHGANNVYVVDKQVKNGVLIVRSAKWLFIHHSCGWGHDYRNDEFKNRAHAHARVPLEIVIGNLWDGNFHANAKSGDEYRVLVTKKGVPVKGAKVTVTTEKNWVHTAVTDETGSVNIQLIRDYYPKGWQKFNRRHQGRFSVIAEHSLEGSGQYNGQPYQRTLHMASFCWKYSPAAQDYNSYAFGLGIGFVSLAFTGIGIYHFRKNRIKPYKGVNLG